MNDRPSLNCLDGRHEACWGCLCPQGCHSVPPTDDWRAVAEAIRERNAERRDTTEETP